MRAELERLGRRIGANDLWIAAHALALGATLVTDDADLDRVEELRTENWLRA
jgi:tRNA(fMet)-specific endonuclease VapC